MERLRETNAGAAIAIAAGALSLAVTTFGPPLPQNNLGTLGSAWGLVVHGLGVVLIGAPFIASLWPGLLGLAKALLAIAGILLLGSGIASYVMSGINLGATLVDTVPGFLGLLAAWLLRPLRRPEVERAVAETAEGRARRAQAARDAQASEAAGRGDRAA